MPILSGEADSEEPAGSHPPGSLWVRKDTSAERSMDRFPNPPETPSTRNLRTRAYACLLSIALAAFAACSDGPAAPPQSGGPNDPPPSQPTPYDHALGPGASAHDLLSADDFDSLVVEINYTAGHRPTDEGLESLSDFIVARLNKPAGVEIRIGEALPTTSQATYTVAEVRALELQHRSAFTQGRTIAVHFLFLGGEFAEQSNVLGFASWVW